MHCCACFADRYLGPGLATARNVWLCPACEGWTQADCFVVDVNERLCKPGWDAQSVRGLMPAACWLTFTHTQRSRICQKFFRRVGGEWRVAAHSTGLGSYKNKSGCFVALNTLCAAQPLVHATSNASATAECRTS